MNEERSVKEQKNSKVVYILLGMLIVIIVCLVGFIISDKMLDDTSDNNNVVNNEVINNVVDNQNGSVSGESENTLDTDYINEMIEQLEIISKAEIFSLNSADLRIGYINYILEQDKNNWADEEKIQMQAFPYVTASKHQEFYQSIYGDNYDYASDIKKASNYLTSCPDVIGDGYVCWFNKNLSGNAYEFILSNIENNNNIYMLTGKYVDLADSSVSGTFEVTFTIYNGNVALKNISTVVRN